VTAPTGKRCEHQPKATLTPPVHIHSIRKKATGAGCL